MDRERAAALADWLPVEAAGTRAGDSDEGSDDGSTARGEGRGAMPLSQLSDSAAKRPYYSHPHSPMKLGMSRKGRGAYNSSPSASAAAGGADTVHPASKIAAASLATRRAEFERYCAEETAAISRLHDMLVHESEEQRKEDAAAEASHRRRMRQLVYEVDTLTERRDRCKTAAEEAEAWMEAAEAELASSAADARALADEVSGLEARQTQLLDAVARHQVVNARLIEENQRLRQESYAIEHSDLVQSGRAKAADIDVLASQKARLLRTNAALRVQSVVRRRLWVEHRRRHGEALAALEAQLKAATDELDAADGRAAALAEQLAACEADRDAYKEEVATMERRRQRRLAREQALSDANVMGPAASSKAAKLLGMGAGSGSDGGGSGSVAGGSRKSMSVAMGMHHFASLKHVGRKLGRSLRNVNMSGGMISKGMLDSKFKKSKSKKIKKPKRRKSEYDPIYVEELVFPRSTQRAYPEPVVPDSAWLETHNHAWTVQSAWEAMSGNASKSCLTPAPDRSIPIPERASAAVRADSMERRRRTTEERYDGYGEALGDEPTAPAGVVIEAEEGDEAAESDADADADADPESTAASTAHATTGGGAGTGRSGRQTRGRRRDADYDAAGAGGDSADGDEASVYASGNDEGSTDEDAGWYVDGEDGDADEYEYEDDGAGAGAGEGDEGGYHDDGYGYDHRGYEDGGDGRGRDGKSKSTSRRGAGSGAARRKQSTARDRHLATGAKPTRRPSRAAAAARVVASVQRRKLNQRKHAHARADSSSSDRRRTRRSRGDYA